MVTGLTWTGMCVYVCVYAFGGHHVPGVKNPFVCFMHSVKWDLKRVARF